MQPAPGWALNPCSHPPFAPHRLLNEATGSLLDDLQLVTTLQSSKVTAGEVSDQLATSEATEAKIDAAREVRGWGWAWLHP